MSTARTCLVSFTDSNGIRHAVEVAASTLYEAATLAMAEFRRCGFTENAPGPATRLTVTVKAPATSHEVQWGKVEVWLQSATLRSSLHGDLSTVIESVRTETVLYRRES